MISNYKRFVSVIFLLFNVYIFSFFVFVYFLSNSY